MEERPEVYFIPTNIANNGNIIKGYFKKKNAYEAAAIFVAGLLLSVILLGFLPVIPRVIIFCVFLIIAFFALAGIKGQSFFEYLLEFIFFKKKRRVMKFRLPRKEKQEQKKWRRGKKGTEEEI